MLIVVLASLLAAPPSGDEPWFVRLRPAIVVQDSEVAAESTSVEEAPEPSRVDPPRLAPAKTVKAKSTKAPKRSPKRASRNR